MATAPGRTQVDERVMTSGTTVRFAQMIVLMVVATAGLATIVAIPTADGPQAACFLAAGLDPEQVTFLNIVRAFGFQEAALASCVDRQSAEDIPAWLVAAWPALMAAVGFALFKTLPALKIRWRGRTRPLTDEAALRHLGDLAKEAGLQTPPDFQVHTRRLKARAVTFGSDRRPVVRLNRGLLWIRERDRERFRVIVLHEFAHIRNRDITITYATTTLWWAFIAVVVLPFTALELASLPDRLQTALSTIELISATRVLAMALTAVALVHFARQEVLRSREMYADLTAKHWNADLREFDFGPEAPVSARRIGRARAALAELLRTHPSLTMRRNVLGDNAELFTVRAPLVILTGIGALLIGEQTSNALRQVPFTAPDAVVYATLIAAALVTGVVGLGIWRAVTYAAIVGKSPPPGVSTGAWLGLGLVLGELIRGGAGEFRWAPPHPEMFIVLFGVGAAFGWWTAVCARLWTAVWRGRSIAPPAALVLAGGGIALASALHWWEQVGLVWANGFHFDAASLAQSLAGGSGPGVIGGDESWTAVIAAAYHVLLNFMLMPFAWAAVAATGLVPLLAWATRPSAKPPLWIRRKGRAAPVEGLPPLRRILLAAMLGTAASWIGAVAGMALLHRWRALAEGPPTVSLAVAVVMAAVAMIVGACAAAAVAAASVDRVRLGAALIAANLAVAAGFAGILALLSADGCVPQLTVVSGRCGGIPVGVSWDLLQIVVPSVFVLADVVAVLAAAAAAALARRRRLRNPMRAGSPAAIRSDRSAVRVSLAAVSALAVGFALAAETLVLQYAHQSSAVEDDSGWDASIQPAAEAGPSDYGRALQIVSWLEVGGEDLLDRLAAALDGLADIGQAVNEPIIENAALRQGCTELAALVADAEEFFAIPHPEAQELWALALERIGVSAQACVNGFEQRNAALIEASLEGQLAGLAALTEAVGVAAAATAGTSWEETG